MIDRDRSIICTALFAVLFNGNCLAFADPVPETKTKPRVETPEDKAKLQMLTDAINRNPNSSEAYSDRALFYMAHGQRERAIADYDKEIRIDPNRYATYFMRGLAYFMLGQNKKAIEDFSKDIELNPTDKGKAGGYVYRAMCYRELKDYKNAIQDYTKAINANPTGSYAYYQMRGGCYQESGESQKAINDCNKALGIKPDSAHAYWIRGQANEKLGKKQLSAADKAKALKLGYKPRKE